MKHDLQQLFIEVKSNQNIDIKNNLATFFELNNINPELFTDGNYNMKNNNFSYNQNNFISIFQPSRININFNQYNNYKVAINKIRDILKIVFDQNVYKDFSRVGIRLNMGYKCNSDIEIYKLLKNSFLNCSNLDKFCTDENIKNLGIRFSVKNNDYSINYNIAPGMSKNIKVENGQKVSELDVLYLVFDIDIYKEGQLNSSNILDFCESTKTNFEETFKKIEEILDNASK